MRRLLLLSALTALASTAPAAAAPAAGAKKKTPPACGARILPLVVGNTWTYKPSAPRTAKGEDIKPDPAFNRIIPKQPEEVVITVTNIETTGQETTVSLEEKSSFSITVEKKSDKSLSTSKSELLVKSTIVCSRTKFEISPESFLFSGEPGGAREIAFSEIKRSQDTSWKLVNGTMSENPWREDIVATFQRTAAPAAKVKLSGGKLELERKFIPEAPESISVVSGEQYAQVDKMTLTTTGRVTLDEAKAPNAKPMDLPQGWNTRYWIKNDVGLVRVLNSFAHQYDLVAHTLN